MRLFLASAGICTATWLTLAVGAGYAGLSRSVGQGPQTLLFEVPIALVLVAIVALVTGYVAARILAIRPAALLLGVLAGDAFAALVLAPFLIGELEVVHAPVVFGSVTALGIQPLAVMVGAWMATRRQTGP
jgi:hypothetical protein